MAEEKTRNFRIVINGIEESVNAVKTLNEQLKSLEDKLKSLESKNINVSSKGGGGGNSALEAQDKLQKDILATEQKLAAVRDENYKKLLHMKEELKEYTQIAKSQVAAESNQQGLYDLNTMAGMKAQLKSIKAEMQTVEIGGDRFKELVAQANELNNKLKEIESSYGQYGRNVGNYANGVAEGIEKLKIDVGGVIQEFDNAKQAMATLRKEMQTLSTKKDMGIISSEEEERLKGLIPVVKQLESSIADAGKPMDALMDTMQSLTAIASTAQGIGALFGMDSSEIERSIQKLVALQNVMQGLQTLQKQMQTGEGIGGWLTKGNAAIDKMVTSMFGLTTATKGATIATKTLGTALKAIGIGVLVAGIATLIDMLERWSDKQKQAAEEAEEAAEKTRKAIEDQRNAFVGASATYMNTASRLSHLRAEYMTTNDQLKKTTILKEASEEFKKLGLSVNGVTDAQKILVNQGDKVIEMLRLQGDAAALASLRMEAYKKHFQVLLANGSDVYSASIRAGNDPTVVAIDKQLDVIKQQESKIQKELGLNIKNGVSKASKEVNKAVVDAEALISKARVDAMKNGFTKTMTELVLERNKRIAEAKKSGRMVQEQIALINRTYEAKIFDARVEYHTNLLNEERKYVEQVAKLNEEMFNKEVEISRKRNELRLENNIEGLSRRTTTNNGDTLNTTDFDKELRNLTYDYNFDLPPKVLRQYKELQEELKNTEIVMDALNTSTEIGLKEFEEYSKKAYDIANQLKEIGEKYPQIATEAERIVGASLNDAIIERTISIENYYNQVLQFTKEAADKELEIEKEKLESELKLTEENEKKRHKIAISRFYNGDITQDERDRFKTPITAFETYMEEDAKGNLLGKTQSEIGTYFSEYRKLMDEWVDNLKKGVQEGKYTWEEYNEFINQEAIQGYLKAKDEYENLLLSGADEGKLKEYTANLNNAYVVYLDKIREEQEIHNNQMRVIQNKYNVDVEQAEKEHQNRNSQATVDYYSQMANEYERAISAISQKIDKAETKNAWGIINYGATKKALKDLQDSISTTLNNIEVDKMNLITKLKEGEISFGDFSTLFDQLNSLEVQTQDTAKNVQNKLKNLTGEWWGSIDQWIQAVGQAMNTILSSLSEIESNQYDAMIDKQEKYIEEYEKLLDKQKEITENHASALESIEDELANSRGDRRQQLIDMLNAEMAAQRASLAQEKKIEKEREKAEQKKKKMEHDQAVAKKRMQEAQAYINMAMAISMAAVNSWPIPAIPMMALAAAAGAAQIAAIKSTNIPSYGDGGVIQGKSHKQGGVPILGGRAEVEGNEFITNKLTTQKNTDLLYYINSKKKRLDINDFIEFYSGHSTKNRYGVKTKFADGGMIPTLRDDIDLSDRLLNAFEDYSNRPVQVAVVDIIDRTQQVNDVKVMAGIE